VLFLEPVAAHGQGKRPVQAIIVKAGQVIFSYHLPRLRIVAQHTDLRLCQIEKTGTMKTFAQMDVDCGCQSM